MRASSMAVLATAFAGFLPVGISSASAEEVARPAACVDGVRVTIEGTLHLYKEYGPPGWGEDPAHDAPWTMTTLSLTEESRGIVAAFLKRCEEDEATADAVQLWVDKRSSLPVRAGQTAVVQGKLRLTTNRPDEIRPGQVEVSTLTIR